MLLSIAYAADVGDPEGTVLLADDVSQRHDFGFGAKDGEIRVRTAWALPRVEVNPGVPWHVSGSLLGLDIGLGSLALRRVNFERVLEAPRLTSNERDAFAISVSLMNPFELRDADRDAITDALARHAARRPHQRHPIGIVGRPHFVDEILHGAREDDFCDRRRQSKVPEHRRHVQVQVGYG